MNVCSPTLRLHPGLQHTADLDLGIAMLWDGSTPLKVHEGRAGLLPQCGALVGLMGGGV